MLQNYRSSEVGQSHYDYFTQLVWADSKEVGCGGVKFKVRVHFSPFSQQSITKLTNKKKTAFTGASRRS